MQDFLKNLPALSHPVVTESSVPRDPIEYLPEELEIVFLNFRGLIFLFNWPIFLRTGNSTGMWSLQPWLPPVLTSPISSLQRLWPTDCTPSGRVVYYLTQKFTHSRSFLNFLKLIVLLSQQMSRWLKSFSRMRSCEHNASCSWNKKAWWVGSLWSGMTIFAQYFSKVFYWQGKKRVSEYLNKCFQKITSKCKYNQFGIKTWFKEWKLFSHNSSRRYTNFTFLSKGIENAH